MNGSHQFRSPLSIDLFRNKDREAADRSQRTRADDARLEGEGSGLPARDVRVARYPEARFQSIEAVENGRREGRRNKGRPIMAKAKARTKRATREFQKIGEIIDLGVKREGKRIGMSRAQHLEICGIYCDIIARHPSAIALMIRHGVKRAKRMKAK